MLHRLNQVTIAKYQDMTALAGRLNEVSQRLNEKCKLIHNLTQTQVHIISVTACYISTTSKSESLQDSIALGQKKVKLCMMVTPPPSLSLLPSVVSLQPYCDQIDQVESSVSALEQMAYRLDAYCKRLEAKFREMERR